MAKPNILTISPFDSTKGTTISFTYVGPQVYGHQIEIIDNASGSSVYLATESTMRLAHTVPANSGLQNGGYYACRVRVRDVNNVYDSWSDYVSFYCFATPVFGFSNLENGQVINASEYEVHLNYFQQQGEPINSYVVELYDANRNLLNRSETMFFGGGMKYLLKMLESSRSYNLRTVGTTLNGIPLDSGFVSFSVSYVMPTMWNFVDLTNNRADGNIRVSSNVKIIDGVAEHGAVEYVDGQEADLRFGNKVTFAGGYVIEKDFNVELIGRNFVNGEIIFAISNGEYDVVIRYFEGWFDSFETENGACAYFTLTVETGATAYQIISNLINRPNERTVKMYAKRIGELYALSCSLEA